MRVPGLHKKQRRLSEKDLERIKKAFLAHESAKALAAELNLSERCVHERYQRLRGYPMRPRQLEKTLKLKREKQFAKWEIDLPRKPKKPLVNPDRFYHSDFEPA